MQMNLTISIIQKILINRVLVSSQAAAVVGGCVCVLAVLLSSTRPQYTAVAPHLCITHTTNAQVTWLN